MLQVPEPFQSMNVFLGNTLQSDWWRSQLNPDGNQFQFSFGMKYEKKKKNPKF